VLEIGKSNKFLMCGWWPVQPKHLVSNILTHFLSNLETIMCLKLMIFWKRCYRSLQIRLN